MKRRLIRIMSERTYTSKEMAELVGVTTRTLYEWLKRGYIREPRRHPRNGYRVFTDNDVHQALLYKNEGIKAGEDLQVDLLNRADARP